MPRSALPGKMPTSFAVIVASPWAWAPINSRLPSTAGASTATRGGAETRPSLTATNARASSSTSASRSSAARTCAASRNFTARATSQRARPGLAHQVMAEQVHGLLRFELEAGGLVDPARRHERMVGPQHHPLVAGGARELDALLHEPRADPAAAGRRLDEQD